MTWPRSSWRIKASQRTEHLGARSPGPLGAHRAGAGVEESATCSCEARRAELDSEEEPRGARTWPAAAGAPQSPSQPPSLLRPCLGGCCRLGLHAGDWPLGGAAAQLHNQTLGAQMRNHSLELHPEPPPASQVINQSQFSENHRSWGPLGTSQQSDFGGSQDASNG